MYKSGNIRRYATDDSQHRYCIVMATTPLVYTRVREDLASFKSKLHPAIMDAAKRKDHRHNENISVEVEHFVCDSHLSKCRTIQANLVLLEEIVLVCPHDRSTRCVSSLAGILEIIITVRTTS